MSNFFFRSQMRAQGTEITFCRIYYRDTAHVAIKCHDIFLFCTDRKRSWATSGTFGMERRPVEERRMALRKLRQEEEDSDDENFY